MKFKLLILAALIGCVSMNTGAEISSQFDDGVGWVNWENSAVVPAAGGFSYGIPDLIAITSDNLTYELLPNTLLYANAVTSTSDLERATWTDSTDGGVTAGPKGAALIDALNYRSGSPNADATNLVFTFDVDANSLDTNYEARAFIKILEPFGDWNQLAYTNVVISNTGPYTLNKEIISGDDAYVFQAGFQLIGLNANADDPAYAGFGSVTATIGDILFQDNDFVAPSPDPMTWASVPAPLSAAAITMTATTAVDTNFTDLVDNGVEYLFSNVTTTATSGWQSSPTWQDFGASTPDTTNVADVITNPSFSPVNLDWNGFEGNPVFVAVDPATFVTSSAGTATVTPASTLEYNYFQEFPAGELQGATTFSIDAANITVNGTEATVFVKEFDDGFGWIGFAGSTPLTAGANSISFTANPLHAYQVGVYTVGTTTGSYDLSNPVLTTDVVTPGISGGLDPLTTYGYVVKARDLSSQLNETAWSTPVASATTLAAETIPPTPDPMTFADAGDASPVSILLTASVATDNETAVQYKFVNTSNSVDSGWQDGTVYLETGLTPNTTYGYTVTARDFNANETAPSAELVVTTFSEPASGALDESLTNLVGDTSVPLVTHNLAKAGLETGSINPAANIVFTSTGAVFSASAGFEGRDVLRTVAAGYSNVSFTAYGTYKNAGTGDMAAFLGVGQGIITGESGSNWGVPELQLAGVNGVVAEFKDASAGSGLPSRLLKIIDGQEIDTPGTLVIGSTEQWRAQLVYNADSNTVRVAVDSNYVIGDAFTEDVLLGEVSTLQNVGATNEFDMLNLGAPVRVYFGGGEGTLVRDIEIIPDTVAPLVPIAGLVISGTGTLQWQSVAGQTYSVNYANTVNGLPGTVDPANENISGTGGLIVRTPTVPGDDVFFQISTDYE